MPELYSNSDLAQNTLKSKTFTCPVGTKGFTLTNYSDVPFQVSTADSQDWGVILPYFTRIYAAKMGDEITLTPQPLLNAQTQLLMFVVYDVSQSDVTPGIIALAQTSGYQMNVAGTVNANITNASMPITGNVGITSGNINATIQNASLNSQITNANLQTTNSVISSLTKSLTFTANVTQYSAFQFTIPPAIYDSIYLLVKSGGAVGTYSFLFNEAFLNTVDNWTKEGPNVPIPLTVSIDATKAIYGPIKLTDLMADKVFIGITASASVTDTITVQLIAKYASQTVTNPTSAPVNVNQLTQTTHYSGNGTSVSRATFTLLPSGGIIYKLFVKVINQGTGTTWSYIYHNGALVDEAWLTANAQQSQIYDFGYGIANNGFTIDLAPNSQFVCYAVTST